MDAAGTDSVDLIEHRSGGIRLYVNPRCSTAVAPDDLLRLPEIVSDLPGRSTRQKGLPTSWRWHPAWGPEAGLVVRLYAHGGLLGPALGTRFLSARRMLNELRTAIRACDDGVPTAVPLAVRIERTAGAFLTAHYVSEAVPDTVDLLTLLTAPNAAPPAASAARRRLALAAADAVAAMHNAGIRHADLSLGNLLVQGTLDAARVFIIDFDKARRTDAVTPRQRIANLLRLDRSVRKRPASREAVGPQDRLRFLRAYADACPHRQPDWRQVARHCGA